MNCMRMNDYILIANTVVLSFSTLAWHRGGSSPKLNGGQFCRVGGKNTAKGKRAKGAQKFLALFSVKIIWFFNLIAP